MRQTERGGTERTGQLGAFLLALALLLVLTVFAHRVVLGLADRKSTRLNSSH